MEKYLGILLDEFERIHRKIEKVADKQEDDHRKIVSHLAAHERGLATQDDMLDRLETQLFTLESQQQTQCRKITTIYDLALENWGQIEETKTRIDILEEENNYPQNSDCASAQLC